MAPFSGNTEEEAGPKFPIPGYRYDRKLNRYFKLERGRTDKSPSLHDTPCKRTAKRRRLSRDPTNIGTSLYRYIANVEEGKTLPSRVELNSRVLASSPRASFDRIDYDTNDLDVSIEQRQKFYDHYQSLVERNKPKSLWDIGEVNSFVEVREKTTSVQINFHLYPIGGALATFEPSRAQTCVTHGAWIALGSDSGMFYQVSKFRITQCDLKEEQRLLLYLRRPFAGRMAISSDGLPALAVNKKVYILDTEPGQLAPRAPRPVFNVAGLSAIDNLKFFGTRIAGSLWNGKLFMYDIASPTSPIWGSRGNTRVADMQSCDGGKILYTSSMLNYAQNLLCWDTRLPCPATPVLRFEGHRNSHKLLRFHVDTNYACGILAAGGDDGVVRLWDARKAELPLSSIDLKGETPEAVKLVGFREGPVYNPSLWVQTDKSLYLYEKSQLCM